MMYGFQMFFSYHLLLATSQSRAGWQFFKTLVVVYVCFSLYNWPYTLALCSNIEDISRDAGSVDIEEDVLDSMLLNLMTFVFVLVNNDAN